MEHADGVARRPVRDGGPRRSSAPATRRARRARDGVTTAWCAAAGVGLALTVAVGITTVTATLVEGDGTDRVPAVAPGGPPTPGAETPDPGTPNPGMLRLWGLRVSPPGVLTPSRAGEEVPRTVLEQLYADLAPAR